jgi:N-acetylated-alpha-linked acidic dipeptidase
MKIFFFAVLLFIAAQGLSQDSLMGFSAERVKQQLQWEKTFDSLLSHENPNKWMQYLASHPHHLGSAKDKANAEYIAALFKKWGYDVNIETYDVLFPTPKTRALQLQGAHPYTAKLQEAIVPQDKATAQRSEQLPPYNAYSADGDVTAPLVFVNRGVPADYEVLERMGIDVKGKIVIAKYGGSWRGIKPKVAAEHGAIGCIIYSDPRDDGYSVGDVYPKGPYRPATSVQRGSVMDMPVYPGDPLTPGEGSTKNARRLDRAEAITLMKIPVLPISYEDALPLMKSLKGPVAPASWRGGLPITYHVGPGTDKVHLKLEFNWQNKTLYNVIAKLKGSELPDEWVIRGNHHDAWVNGASDPVSGIVSEMEEARVIAEMVRRGYKLKRTLVYCAWDAEEQGLLGSTEWTEDHRGELTKKAVLYVNSDATARGFISAAGSHTLEPFFNEVASAVIDPQTGVSIRDRSYAKKINSQSTAESLKDLGDKNLKLGALGAGSDWSGFLQHLGITTLNLSFQGEGEGGEYHSIYDTYDHFTRFMDPGFHYVVALAKTAGRVMMRMANAEVLPLDYKSLATTVMDYRDEIKKLLDNMRNETKLRNKMVSNNLFKLAEDPQDKLLPVAMEDTVPRLDFSALDRSLDSLKATAAQYRKLSSSATDVTPGVQRQLNVILYGSERQLLTEKGLPKRPWYRHQVYAPGYYTGYGVKTLPGIREAIEQRQWKEAQENIRIVTRRVQDYHQLVKQAVDILNQHL